MLCSLLKTLFQLGGGQTGGDMLGGLGDIFGMPSTQSYVPPQEVGFSNFLRRHGSLKDEILC